MKVILSRRPKIRIAMVPVSTGRLPPSEPRRNPPHGSGSSFGHPPQHALHHAGLRRAGDGESRRISSCRQYTAGQSRLGDRRNPCQRRRDPPGLRTGSLAFHEITNTPRGPRRAAARSGGTPPGPPADKTYQLTGEAYTESVETHELYGVIARIYSPEKARADCFKFCNKVGIDTAVEAVRFYRECKRVKMEDLVRYAAICRVTKIIRPYLETLL